MSYNGFVCIDVETTGLYYIDRIVEFAAICLDRDGNVTHQWETTINPNRDIGPTHIHNLSVQDVKYAPNFEEVSNQIFSTLEGRTLIGHNVGFDLRCLLKEWERMDISCGRGKLSKPRNLDTYHATNLKLEDACEMYGITNIQGHSAMGDALATVELFRVLLENDKRFKKLYKKALKSQPAVDHTRFIPSNCDGMPTPRGILKSTEQDPNLVDTLERYIELGSMTTKDILTIRDYEASILPYLHTRIQELETHKDETLFRNLKTFAEAIGVNSSYYTALDSAFAFEPSPNIETSELVSGDRIAVTGVLDNYERDEIEELLEFIGISVKGIAKSTKVLVASDADSMSQKANKARQYGIPIVDEEWLMKLLKENGY